MAVDLKTWTPDALCARLEQLAARAREDLDTALEGAKVDVMLAAREWDRGMHHLDLVQRAAVALVDEVEVPERGPDAERRFRFGPYGSIEVNDQMKRPVSRCEPGAAAPGGRYRALYFLVPLEDGEKK